MICSASSVSQCGKPRMNVLPVHNHAPHASRMRANSTMRACATTGFGSTGLSRCAMGSTAPRSHERVSDGEGQFIAQVNVQDRRIRVICVDDLYGTARNGPITRQPCSRSVAFTCRPRSGSSSTTKTRRSGKTRDFFDIRGGRSSELAKRQLRQTSLVPDELMLALHD